MKVFCWTVEVVVAWSGKNLEKFKKTREIKIYPMKNMFKKTRESNITWRITSVITWSGSWPIWGIGGKIIFSWTIIIIGWIYWQMRIRSEFFIWRNFIGSSEAIWPMRMIIQSFIVREICWTIVVVQVPVIVHLFKHGFLSL